MLTSSAPPSSGNSGLIGSVCALKSGSSGGGGGGEHQLREPSCRSHTHRTHTVHTHSTHTRTHTQAQTHTHTHTHTQTHEHTLGVKCFRWSWQQRSEYCWHCSAIGTEYNALFPSGRRRRRNRRKEARVGSGEISLSWRPRPSSDDGAFL